MFASQGQRSKKGTKSFLGNISFPMHFVSLEVIKLLANKIYYKLNLILFEAIVPSAWRIILSKTLGPGTMLLHAYYSVNYYYYCLL